MLSRAYSSFILTLTAVARRTPCLSPSYFFSLHQYLSGRSDSARKEAARQSSAVHHKNTQDERRMQPASVRMCAKLYRRDSASRTRARAHLCGARHARRCFVSVNGDELDLQVEGGVWGDQPGKTLLSIRQLAWHLEARLLTQAEP